MYLNFTRPGCSAAPVGLLSSHPRLKFIMRGGFFYVSIVLLSIQLLLADTGKGQSLDSISVTVELHNENLKKLFKIIEGQTRLMFAYQPQQVESYNGITLQRETRSVRETLDIVLAGTPLAYRQVNNNVIIFSGEESRREVGTETPRAIGIVGRVIDPQGGPIPGVNVIEKGTVNGTTTDSEGRYAIEVSGADAVLVFSFIGYATQEVGINGRSVIDVTLVSDVKRLDEVVVIGYGTQKKRDLTGAVTSVALDDSPLGLFSYQNAFEALRGSASGINVGIVTEAGREPALEIRGQNSIHGSNIPLIVVDGVIFTGSMSDINPNDIATFDILRDAVSAAVYGARSANGVIVITTKKGKTEKPAFAFNASTVFKQWRTQPDLMNGAQYMEIFNAKYRQPANSTVNLTGSELKNYEDGVETDWLDLITRTGVVQDYQLSVSGSSRKLNYYMSSSLNKTRNVIIGDDFNRISVLSKLDMDVTDWFNIGLDASLTRRDYSGVAASLANARTLPPWTDPYRNDAGDLEKYPRENSYVNPLWGVDDGTRDDRDINNLALLRAHASIDVPWIKGLNFTIRYQNSFDRRDVERFFYESYYVNEGSDIERYDPDRIQALLVRANGDIRNQKTDAYVLDNILSYRREFNRHSIYATLVATRDKKSVYDVMISGTDFSDNGNTSLGVWGYNKARLVTSDVDTYIVSNIGYLGRLNYSFDDKYFVSGSVRRDGASVFGENNKWGTFSAVGLAWRITSESFFKTSKIINDLKLKLSWGQNGNQGIGPYTTLSTVRNGLGGGSIYEFPDAPESFYFGLYQDRLGNPNLGWETTESVNTGFESALLNNRLFLDLDIYFTQTRDQLFDRIIPIMSGFNTMKASMGQVNNNGVEITARTVNIRNKNGLSWESSVNAWKNYNKLVHLYGEDLDGDGKEDDDITNNLFIGHSIGAIFGYVQDGIVQEDDTEYIAITGSAPGDPKFKDLDGIEGISTADRKIVGYTKPNFRLSLGNTVAYRNFSLYLLFSGTFGGNNFYLERNRRAFSSATPSRSSENGIYLPYWTPENRNNVYPAVTYNPDERYLGLQSRSYFKLQRVSLSYSLQQRMLDSMRINSLKVFLTAEELLTFTSWTGGDPEANIGAASSAFPVTTNYSIGINLNF